MTFVLSDLDLCIGLIRQGLLLHVDSSPTHLTQYQHFDTCILIYVSLSEKTCESHNLHMNGLWDISSVVFIKTVEKVKNERFLKLEQVWNAF